MICRNRIVFCETVYVSNTVDLAAEVGGLAKVSRRALSSMSYGISMKSSESMLNSLSLRSGVNSAGEASWSA
ncbi:hypothetical protein RTCIAT899_PC01660 (plasmid) [Rhizobium tropici CIAT 899]|nr:hypothetical protein RTCIAT899_PC01660 [Rhizobium tropici CIAT 899]